MKLALVGNQNCGKTTLFNQLTGSNQRVGNFPGVTVEQKMGKIKGHNDVLLIDLPGIYSLRTYSAEEKITRDFILNEKPDGIINIVDATNIERNLYLTLQLIDLNIPMVVALNMMDEIRGNGGTIKLDELEELLGVPVVPISALKNEGIAELVNHILTAVNEDIKPKVTDFCAKDSPVHRCIHAICHIVEDHAQKAKIPIRFATTNLIEHESDITEKLSLDENELDMIEHAIVQMETEHEMDRHAALADMRYAFVDELCAKTVIKPKESKEFIRSQKIDKILTNKYAAIPVFIGIMALIFWLTFDVIGQQLSDLLALGIDALASTVDTALTNFGINHIVHSLIIDGIFAGVGSVLSFVPLIVVLFFFLSILEDTGYMARIAFVMDKLLRKIGLSGRSIVPMLIGFGCSVPAIMSTRTLSSERDRKMTILLIPFMSCTAKIPIYLVFSAAFFPGHAALTMIILYFGGILVGILTALMFKNTIFKGNPVPFVMELPNYRMPSAKNVVLLLWEKAKDFLTRAFTIIFFASVVVWFLQSFDLRFNYVEDSSTSLLAGIGRAIAPIFTFNGFADWRASTALLSGFIAKEVVISTLQVLLKVSEAGVSAALSSTFSTAQAVSFLTFTLLYTPCVAAFSTTKKELKSFPKAVGVALFQSAVAWLVSLIVFQIARVIL